MCRPISLTRRTAQEQAPRRAFPLGLTLISLVAMTDFAAAAAMLLSA